MVQQRTADRDGTQQKANHTPWLEWVASGIGLLLTLGIFGSIGWQAFDDAGAPPAIAVDVTRVVPVEGGYRVEFRARNSTGSTASQVEIEGKLAGDGAEAEIGHVVFDYIPGHSERKGGMFFTREPRQESLALRALGFADP
ncbi:hypothetical protein [Microvirga aerophila]|uniref:TIGR02588 family protein n=1 Tax=Microvirga aerophila TaxID=670291 RepID=A0A512BQI5_9HYPH|nr:hypothetical protein [Microvirga aerophila]GEO14077.1 TIGR02588 family protein [Microvirga aerophila]